MLSPDKHRPSDVRREIHERYVEIEKELDMRSGKAIMTSRREFLTNALGLALITASPWSIRADQAGSIAGQSDARTSKSRRTTQDMQLKWDVLLAPSISAVTSDRPP